MKILVIIFLLVLSILASTDTSKTLSMRTYKKLTTMEILIQENKIKEANKYISKLLSSLPKEPIDKAYILYTAGMFPKFKSEVQLLKI